MLIYEPVLIAAPSDAWKSGRAKQCDKASEATHITTCREMQADDHRAQKVILCHPSKVGEPIANPERKKSSDRDVRKSRDDVLEHEASSDGGQCTLTLQDTVAPPPVRLEVVETSTAVQDKKKELQCELRADQGAIKEEETRPRVQHAPRSCNQCRNTIDETQTTNEPHFDSTASTADSSRHGSQLANILLAAKFTESLSVSAWMPCDSGGTGGSQLSNVTFQKCEGSDLSVVSECEFVNVKFINCKFDRTTFLGVTLSDATFRHVDFTGTAFHCLVLRNVTLTKIVFKDDIWRAMYLENALVSRRSFCMPDVPGSTAKVYGMRALAASSKTRRFAILDVLSTTDLSQAVGHDGAWNRDIHLRFVFPKLGILARMARHPDIIDRIMRFCFPGSSVHVHEYPRGFKIAGDSAMSKKLYEKRNGTRTTYYGSLQHGLLMKTETTVNVPCRGVGNCTGLLLVNKELSTLALKHLYGRDVHLQCSAEGAREFLFAHKRMMTSVRRLVLYYHWKADNLGLETDINAWIHLLNTIRHRFSFFPVIGLHMGQTFWKRNQPTRSVERVLCYHSESHEDCPIGGAHKFAAPDDRWEWEGVESTHRTDGTLLQIHIEDTSTQARIDFVQKLVAEIERQRVGRSLFVRSPEGEEITYRCAKKSPEN
jgi:uncharacterized protein YjbI with pentapeptide repeats